MFRRAINAVVDAVERGFYSVEMGIVALRRLCVADIGSIVRDFDRLTAQLDSFADAEVAANQRDYERLNELYDRIEARRDNIGRAKVTAQNLRKLTGAAQ